MADLRSVWVPGHACFPEWPAQGVAPSGLGPHRRPGRGHAQLGARVDRGAAVRAAAVHFLYEARGSSFLDDAQVFTGSRKLAGRENLGWCGNHAEGLDGQNGMEIVPEDPKWAGDRFAAQGSASPYTSLAVCPGAVRCSCAPSAATTGDAVLSRDADFWDRVSGQSHPQGTRAGVLSHQRKSLWDAAKADTQCVRMRHDAG